MPYKLDVLIDKRVVLLSMLGDYTAQDAAQFTQQTLALLDTASTKNFIILADTKRLNRMPNNVIELRNANQGLFTHPNLAMMIIYGSGDKTAMNFFGGLAAKLFRLPVKILSTEDEVLRYLASSQPELAESLPLALKTHHQREQS